MMSFLEKIKMDDKLVIYCKEPNGKVHRKVIKEPFSEMNPIKKVLFLLGLVKQPGTVSNNGKDQAAKLYGNTGTPKSVDRIGAYAGSYTWVAAAPTFAATGKITFDNSANPWSTQANYTKVGICNNTDTANPHAEINISINTTATPLTWWAEITVTFS